MSTEQQPDLEARTEHPLGSRANPFVQHHDEFFFGDVGPLLATGVVSEQDAANMVTYRDPTHKQEECLFHAAHHPAPAKPWYAAVVNVLSRYRN